MGKYATKSASGVVPTAQLGTGTANSSTFLRGDQTWDSPGASSAITQLTGDVTAGPGVGSQAATIPNDTVTYAKMQNMATARVLGRTTGGSGDVEELSAGAGISISGGTVASTITQGFTQKVVQVFTTPGAITYTPTAGMKYCTVYCTGGGGASGDATGTDAVSGGGGGGGTAIKTFTAATIGASKAGVVGAGGTRADPGGTGVNSTFVASSLVGNGGVGSAQSAAGFPGVGPGGTGGVASGGDVNVVGQGGSLGVMSTTTIGFGGTGGSSYWGGGPSAVTSDTAGVAGTNYGSGAAGAHAASATDRLGANGAGGIIYIEEFI